MQLQSLQYLLFAKHSQYFFTHLVFVQLQLNFSIFSFLSNNFFFFDLKNFFLLFSLNGELITIFPNLLFFDGVNSLLYDV